MHTVNHEVYLRQLYEELMAAPLSNIELNLAWCRRFSPSPGVYIFRDLEKIIYVGETGNLSERMSDLRRTVNHTLRRNIGNSIFSDVEGWQKATSKRRFTDTIETMLDEHFRKNLTVTAFQVNLGRCELEEMIIALHKPQYNRKKKRE